MRRPRPDKASPGARFESYLRSQISILQSGFELDPTPHIFRLLATATQTRTGALAFARHFGGLGVIRPGAHQALRLTNPPIPPDTATPARPVTPDRAQPSVQPWWLAALGSASRVRQPLRPNHWGEELCGCASIGDGPSSERRQPTETRSAGFKLPTTGLLARLVLRGREDWREDHFSPWTSAHSR